MKAVKVEDVGTIPQGSAINESKRRPQFGPWDFGQGMEIQVVEGKTQRVLFAWTVTMCNIEAHEEAQRP